MPRGVSDESSWFDRLRPIETLDHLSNGVIESALKP
jgi:hypothetical protein